MERLNRVQIWVILAGVFAILAASSARAEEARDRTEALITAFRKVELAPQGQPLTAALREKNRPIFEALDGFFSQARLVDDPIAPHRARLTEPQLKRYRELFWATLRQSTYLSTGRFFEGATWTLKPGAVGPDKADVDVQVRVEAKDLDTRITFHWAKLQGKWLLVDLSFDGASLVKDYQVQFGRLLDKEGAPGLLAKLEARFQKEVAEKGAVK